MNYIIEFLPKKENQCDFVVVVRTPNGYPLAVCDTLEDAMVVIKSKFDEVVKANKPNS